MLPMTNLTVCMEYDVTVEYILLVEAIKVMIPTFLSHLIIRLEQANRKCSPDLFWFREHYPARSFVWVNETTRPPTYVTASALWINVTVCMFVIWGSFLSKSRLNTNPTLLSLFHLVHQLKNFSFPRDNLLILFFFFFTIIFNISLCKTPFRLNSRAPSHFFRLSLP